MLAGEVETALRQLNELANNGKDLGRLLSDLLNHFRNLLIFQVSRGDLNLLEVSEAEAAALKEQSALASAEALTRILEVLADAEMRLRDAASKKILVEVALLKAIEARSAVSLDSRSEAAPESLRGGKAGEARRPAPRPRRQPARGLRERRPPARREPGSHAPRADAAAGAAVPAPAAAAAAVRVAGRSGRAVGQAGGSGWPRQPVHPQLPAGSAPGFVPEERILTIGFDPEFEDHLGLVDNARNHTLLQTKLAELGHAERADQVRQGRSARDRRGSEPPAPESGCQLARRHASARTPAAPDRLPPPRPPRRKSRPRCRSTRTISRTIR